MEDSDKKPYIDLKSLEMIQDIEAMRAALRLAIEQMNSAEKEQNLRNSRTAAEQRASGSSSVGRYATRPTGVGGYANDNEKIRLEAENEISGIKNKLDAALEELNDWRRRALEAEAGLSKTEKSLSEALEKNRSAEIAKQSVVSRLNEWERKSAEIENARKDFLSLMSQLSEAKKQAADSKQALLAAQKEKETVENKTCLIELEKEALSSRLNEWERKAAEIENARKEFLAIISKIPGGMDAREALTRMLEEKNAAENKTRLIELEKEACMSRLKDWENKAAEIENLYKDLEIRENKCKILEKSLGEKELYLERRLVDMEDEYARKRKDIDEFKEKMRKEVNELTKIKNTGKTL
ncbi:MAG: hypothetical protein HY746_04285 [Elusimicrobia bacterium]|nr:hypothetical protein [Elusimicrobiota bacterium]